MTTSTAARAAEEMFQTGVRLAQTGRFDDALALFEKTVADYPRRKADALTNIGFCLKQVKRVAEAEAAYRQAIALGAGPDAVSNLASLLHDRGAYEESRDMLRATLARHPDHIAGTHNLANALLALGDIEECRVLLEKVVAARPDMLMARKNLGIVRMTQGDFIGGFAEFEHRLPFPETALALPLGAFGVPVWNGEDVRGKTVLGVTEQGLGDSIQFLRYGARIKARGGRFLITCSADLEKLLADCPCVDGLLRNGDPKPTVDYMIPLLSLPRVFADTPESIPADTPYLRAAPETAAKWRRMLGEKTRPRVGIVWAGNPNHGNDHNRSIPSAMLAEIVEDPRIDPIGVQVGYRPDDPAFFDAHPRFRQFGPLFRDFADTAGLLENLDLVLTVDTSVAHLAGALGRPTWVMLPYSPDWRWMLKRTDSPWYPGMRLFRQPTPGDWSSALRAVAAALGSLSPG